MQHPDVVAPARRAVPSPRKLSEPQTPSRSPDLDVLRVVAICGVVAIHIVGMVVSQRQDLRGTPSWWIAVAIDLGSVWVVPVFVMVSGALLLHPRAHRDGPKAFYRKRALRIVPPLIVWNVLHVVVVRTALHHDRFPPRVWATMVIDAKLFTGAYFLWLILGLYAIAPVLAAFLHAGGPRRAAATAAAVLGWTMVAWMLPGVTALLGAPRPITLGAWTMWLPYVGYFLAGWALRAVRPGPRLCGVLLTGAVLLLAEVSWQYGHADDHPVLRAIVPPGYLGSVVALASVCLFAGTVGVLGRVRLPAGMGRVLRELSDAAFGVFLIHLIVFALLQRLVPAVASVSSLGVMLSAYAAVLTASFCAVLLLRRIPYARALL